MEIAVAKGRKTRPDIKLGICGEPRSIAFCHKIGLNYVHRIVLRNPEASRVSAVR